MSASTFVVGNRSAGHGNEPTGAFLHVCRPGYRGDVQAVSTPYADRRLSGQSIFKLRPAMRTSWLAPTTTAWGQHPQDVT
ncbi:MAG: hypothetical protein KY439_04180, partial [Actinobacteria bacterium]|nr:hypothetical protein [Actinomycetota bacterium]